MDTSDPLVTIKLTTDNAQSIESLIQLVMITLIILNVKMVVSLTTDIVKLVFKKATLDNTFYTRQEHNRYVSLQDPNEM